MTCSRWLLVPLFLGIPSCSDPQIPQRFGVHIDAHVEPHIDAPIEPLVDAEAPRPDVGRSDSVQSNDGSVTNDTSTTVDPYAFRAPTTGDLFLDSVNGKDSNTGSESAPKKTLTTTLLASLSAGRALWIKNGTYPAVDIRKLPNGTAAMPITVAAYRGHSPTITFAHGGVVVGGGDYWDWRGLRLSAYDKGMILGNTQGTGSTAPTYHWRFIDCIGTKSFAGYTDNSGIIFVDGGAADYIEIIRGSYTGAGSTVFSNSSGLWFDYLKHVTIVGARIDNFELPIYFKHYDGSPQAKITIEIRNNVISRGHRYFALAANYVVLKNNLIVECALYPSERGGGVDGGNYGRYLHNTLVNSDVELAAETGYNLSNTFRDNVFAGTSRMEDAPYTANDNKTDTNYNAFTGGSNVYYRTKKTYSLAGYKAAYPGKEVNSVAGTIAFVGKSPSTSTPTDWALAPGSVGKGNGSDGRDRGVDVTKLLTVSP